MRRSHILPAPVRPEQRRSRLLTTLTLVAGAATVAAIGATSTTGSDPVAAPAAGPAALDRGVGPDGDTTGPVPVVPDGLPLLDGDGASAGPTHGEPDQVGPIERLAQAEPLPSLPTEAERAGSLVYVAADGAEVTPEAIFAFLDGRGAPLAEHAELFVEAGLRHDVDPRVVVAISIAESNGGKMHPEGTHNVWGWGGSGGPAGLKAWDSWEQAIDEYTERLGALYDTDNVDWEFASTYCPPNTQWWIDTVTWAMAQM